MDAIISLAKRRGFVYPGSDVYGGLANSWDYGPLGAELRRNIKEAWWWRFVQKRDDVVGIETALIMNPKVWQASGHLATFSDPLVECKKCHARYRADQLEGACPSCGGKEFSEARQFNLMFKTFIGPAEEAANVAYLRPETAQGMFVNVKNVLDSNRVKLPFGIAQIGKAFRNEITPGNFIFRTREFEQMEIEYFIRPPANDEEWQNVFEHWRNEMHAWMRDVGIDAARVSEFEVPAEDRAHYSKRTIDFMFAFPFGVKELYGLAYRTDFDLKNHMEQSGKDLSYLDPETNERTVPHCVEPTWGVDRTLLAVLLSAYTEEGEGDDARVVLKLKPALAPFKAAVFPLLKNKPELVAKAKEVRSQLMDGDPRLLPIAWDDRGNIGKRYLAQDEIGTPACITVDFQTLEDDTVTIRDRDTKEQRRVAVADLPSVLGEFLAR
ncbi:MAG: glycine--tRNA ligase [Candidatus Yanofskybacteria bacterium]|nr:glycine--tRNA ligase [Candidatus Yanofskybacteria bacterium]